MVAHADPALFSPDPGGIERRFARLMPSLVLGGVVLVGIIWWMAAQPPPGPGWGGPQQQWPQGQQPQQGYPQQGYPQQRPPQPVPQSSCGGCGDIDCSACAAGIDCADCASGCGDCGDCASGLDCGSCAVSGARPDGAATRIGKSCSTSPWNRLAQSSGLLVPLFVLFAWRRRMPRRGIGSPDRVTAPAQT
jgi:hypothetical protein